MWWAVLIGVCLILLAPLLLVDVPPLLDYPNHLARLFLLARLPGDTVLARFYAPHWVLVPDLGIDLAGPPLIRMLPVHVAGRILVGVVLLLPVLGSVAYARAASGRRHWWALGAALVAYNEALLLGFLNFIAATGLALLLAAHWLRWRDVRPRRTVGLAALGVVGLFLCHLMGVVFFVILAGAHELAWAWPRLRARDLGAVVMRAAADAAVLIAPLALYLHSPLAREAAGIVYPALSVKLTRALAPLTNYSLALDVASLAVVLGLLAWLHRGRWPAVSLRAGLTASVVALCYLAAPAEASGVANIDVRFVILGGFLLFALPAPPRMPGWAAAVLAGLFLARMAVLAVQWQGQAAALEDFRALIAPIPPGATVLVAGEPAHPQARLSTGAVTDTHVPALILIERRAWWPFLFDNESQQPVTQLEPYRSLALRIDAAGPAAVRDTRGIDYVLARGADVPAPAGGQVLARNAAGTLYRIRPE